MSLSGQRHPLIPRASGNENSSFENPHVIPAVRDSEGAGIAFNAAGSSSGIEFNVMRSAVPALAAPGRDDGQHGD